MHINHKNPPLHSFEKYNYKELNSKSSRIVISLTQKRKPEDKILIFLIL
ncbi:hypothetical protein ATN83_0717 [Raoultella ornithinolytica]|nr:hypothetical protein ATN83_0717 [Raoultella ornithinolytica]